MVTSRRILAVAAMAGALTACATPQPRYRPPIDLITVPVSFSVAGVDGWSPSGPGETLVKVFEPGSCSAHAFGLRLLSIPDGAPAPAPRNLVADSPVVLTFFRQASAITREACPYSIEFVPTQDFEYQIVFEISEGWCRTLVSRQHLIRSAEQDWSPDPTARPSPLCFDDEIKARLAQDFPS